MLGVCEEGNAVIECPGELKAGPYVYRVGRDVYAGEIYGEMNGGRKTIVFGPGVGGVQALVSLVHEWIHIAEENSTVPGDARMRHDLMRLVSTWVVDLLQQLGYHTELDVSGLTEMRL